MSKDRSEPAKTAAAGQLERGVRRQCTDAICVDAVSEITTRLPKYRAWRVSFSYDGGAFDKIFGHNVSKDKFTSFRLDLMRFVVEAERDACLYKHGANCRAYFKPVGSGVHMRLFAALATKLGVVDCADGIGMTPNARLTAPDTAQRTDDEQH